MKRIKIYKKWGIYQNNEKEVAEYGFAVTILHPNDMDYPHLCSPHDSDMEMNSVEDAVYWINHYND